MSFHFAGMSGNGGRILNWVSGEQNVCLLKAGRGLVNTIMNFDCKRKFINKMSIYQLLKKSSTPLDSSPLLTVASNGTNVSVHDGDRPSVVSSGTSMK
jgi:hypothetical protein